MNKSYAMEHGEKLGRSPNCPRIFVIGGWRPYIWVGNDAHNDMACFATLSDRKKLRQLANAILKAIEAKPTAKRKAKP